MMDQASIAIIVGAVIGAWGSGFAVGKLVAWTRHLQNVA